MRFERQIVARIRMRPIGILLYNEIPMQSPQSSSELARMPVRGVLVMRREPARAVPAIVAKWGNISMTRFIFALIGSMLFGISVSAQTGLGSVRWELSELNGKRFSNSRIYLEFSETEKRITGRAGCNSFSGGYELNNNAFELGGVAATKMVCMRPGTMETESAFLSALGNANRLKKSGRNISFFVGDTRVLRLRAVERAKPEAEDLTAKKWMLRSIGGTAVSLGKDAPFLNFDAEKKSSGGNSGCNVFGGNYEADGPNIKFTGMISTMRACEFEGRMTIERGFIDGLQNADRFEMNSGSLFIYKGSQLLLEFEGAAK